ncbi:MAG: tetratricopeptide repeat protein, partial [Bacteroidota bacterium]
SALSGEKQLWSQEYYVHKSQILNLYHKVTKQISKEINIILTPQEEVLLAETREVDPEAYDAYLKGQYYWEKLDKESMEKALAYFQIAIDKDPEWADPYAGLANAWGMLGSSMIRGLPKSVVRPKRYEYLNKALELDSNSAQAQYVKAIGVVWGEWDWEQGEKEFLRALELNPNDALCHMYYAHLLMILHRSDEAIEQANLGLELDPRRPLVLGLAGVVMMNEGDEQSAILYFEQALSIDPNFVFAKGNLLKLKLGVAYGKGNYKKWYEMWDKKVQGNWSDEGREAVLKAFHEKGHIAGIEEMFKMNEKYGNACYMTELIKAERSIYLKNYDKAIEHLEKAYEKHTLGASYMGTSFNSFDQLKDDPRYIELLKKMNLPLPK